MFAYYSQKNRNIFTNMNRKICAFFLIFSLSFAGAEHCSESFAHNFDTDDNSSFLTLINKILIEKNLLNNSITEKNYSGSIEYLNNIENILEDILISESSFVVDSNQFYNNTIIALVVANLADDVLRNYGAAFGVPSNVMLSMNFANVIGPGAEGDGLSKTSNANVSKNASLHTNHAKTPLENNVVSNTLINPSKYYSATETTKQMIEIFDNDLKSIQFPSISNSSNASNALSKLDTALHDLENSIEMKEKPGKIMEIVHGKVHPNLQIAFSLALKR
jgi:hypothetical protein